MAVLGIGLSAVTWVERDRLMGLDADPEITAVVAADVADLDLREARLGLQRALTHATTTPPTHRRPLNPRQNPAITRSIARLSASLPVPIP